jgi:cytochrome c oxidase subunit III
VNTILLLSSGVTITLAHRAILAGDNKRFKLGLGLTALFGMIFLCVQCLEYRYGVSFY